MSRIPRPALSLLTVLALLVAGLALVLAPPGGTPPAQAATRVDKETCRRIDPNLVNGACLRYRDGEHRGLTWIGTYRAPSGRVFFCIDFLYDSRLPRRAQVVSTGRLVNQLGDRVGDREVAALNHVISTWAGHGSTGSDERDAAIALIIREVMGDGRRRGGTVVYPQGLDVGEAVRPPVGGLDGRIMVLAQQMWRAASAYYGPYRLELPSRRRGPVHLGRSRTYRVQVRAASGRLVPGVRVRFECRGPIRCPRPLVSRGEGVAVRITPRQVGRYRVRAYAAGPSSDGLLYRTRHWHAHGGAHARDAGKQRGWIAQESRTTAAVQASARIRKARPQVVTQTSDAEVTPGAQIHDVVTVTGLPDRYAAQVAATLYGPFDAQPGPDDCTPDRVAGRVTFPVAGDGTYETPPLSVDRVGYYTWVEAFPGDEETVPVTTRCGLVEETTLVVAFTPTISTTASRQRAHVGDAIHDTMLLGGIEDSPVTIEWTLHGPRPAAADGTCVGISWAGSPVAAHGTVAAAGDGRYRTPSTTLRRAGCYTYSQYLPPTPLTTEASSPPGLATETALAVRRTPRVSTVASDQRAHVGVRPRDTVRVSGLAKSDKVTVHWTLHGPLAPRGDGSCRALRWAAAPVADRGVLVARGSGTYETRGTVLAVPGCYTYSERLRATATTEPVATEPGLPLETALVTRPPLPWIPEVPSGGARPDPEASYPTTPTRPRYLYRPYVAPPLPGHARRRSAGELRIDRIGVRAPVDAVGLDHGTMAIPNSRHRLGWLSATAASGDVLGSSVVSGHVSDRHDRPGALWRLRLAQVGDVVRWTEPGGEVRRFVVRSVRRYDRRRGVPGQVFRVDGPHLLHLVTCANRRDLGGGAFHYADNLVVTAQGVS
ncbi:class F sortase [Nocardioides sp. cx-173]|uniref:class F sortase n=1 Tax=Nocardioides sp. cx-173 TaxID=2898796 RepID=UPI001E60111F|nr:class F sortase [Nocardioides sp. cx-173]MCD4527129.1 sortase [Nocardioides sp. cx-173]UGB42492.1 sortase [Nocardioides sp. cx-173]